MINILPGSRVMAFDNRMYINDVKTPPSVTMKPATVVCRYGYKARHVFHCYDDYGNDFPEIHEWKYPDCCDVIFDHDGRLSKAHFTDGLEVM